MNDSLDNTPQDAQESTFEGMSRRGMLLGLGAAAGAVAGAGLLSTDALAAASRAGAVPTSSHPLSSIRPEAVAAPVSGLSYVGIDAHAFVAKTTAERYYQDITGTGNSTPTTGGYIYYPLTFPVGTTIHTIDVGYQQQPILQILRRPITPAIPADAPVDISTPQLPTTGNLPISPGQGFSSTITFKAPITIEANFSYLLAFFVTPGSSVFNAYVGHRLPTQGFIPFTGTTPRVFDSRTTTKFAINDLRVVDLGFVGARTAIINLTVTQTSSAGFVAVFANGIANPGTSSINWSAVNTDIANGVITQVDATGKIQVFASNVTHVVIDRIGFLI